MLAGPPPQFPRFLVCAGCDLGEGQAAPIDAKRSVAPFRTVRHNGFCTFYLKDSSDALGVCWCLLGASAASLSASGVPPDLGASWVPLGCLLGAY